MPRIAKRSLLVVLLGLALPISAGLFMRSIVNSGSGFSHRHDASITALALAPNLARAMTGDSNGELRVTDLTTGQIVSRGRLDAGSIFYLFLLQDNALVVTNDGNLHVVRLTFPEIIPLPGPTTSVRGIYSLLAAPLSQDELVLAVDGLLLHLGGGDFDLPGRPTAIASSPERPDMIALGFADGRIGVVTNIRSSAPAAAQQSTIQLGKPEASDGELIMSDSVSGADRSAVVAVAIVPDGIVSADQNGSIVRWSLEEGKGGASLVEKARSTTPLPRMEVLAAAGEANLLAASSDGEKIAAEVQDGIGVFDGERGRQITLLEGARTSAEFSPDGERLVSSSADGGSRIWEVRTGTLKREFPERVRAIGAHYSPNGLQLVTVALQGDDVVRIWDADSGRVISRFKPESRAYSARFSPEGTRIVTAEMAGTASIWEVSSGRRLMTFRAGDIGLDSAEFAPNGKHIMTLEHSAVFLPGEEDTSSRFAETRVWDVQDGEERALLEGRMISAATAGYTRDGSLIVTSDEDAIGLWDTHSNENVIVIPNHSRPTVGGSSLFSNDKDGAITRLDLSDLDHRCLGCVALRYEKPTTEGESGRLLAVERNGRVKVFDLSDLRKNPEIRYPAMEGRVVAYDRETGAMAITNGKRKVIQMGRAAMDYEGDDIAQIRGLSDGRLVIAALDGSVRIIDPGLQSTLATLDMMPELGTWVSETWAAIFVPEATQSETRGDTSEDPQRANGEKPPATTQSETSGDTSGDRQRADDAKSPATTQSETSGDTSGDPQRADDAKSPATTQSETSGETPGDPQRAIDGKSPATTQSETSGDTSGASQKTDAGGPPATTQSEPTK